MTQEGLPDTSRSIIALRMYHARESFELMAFGALVGIFAGVVGVVLNMSVQALERAREALHGSWLLFLLPAIGATLGILIQRNLFRDYAGHGVADVIQSVTTGRGILPKRLMFSRIISACLTVGSGGSAGLEGPIVISGGALGSVVAQLFRFSQRRRVLLIACGTSGAIAGIFNAPLTGMIFSLEVILGEWKSRNLVPTVTSAAVAAQVSRSLLGDKIPFPREEILHSFPDLPAFVVLGVLTAYTGWLMIKVLDLSAAWFSKIKLPFPVRAGLGGLLVGLCAWFIPEAMGEGYDSVRLYISGNSDRAILSVAALIGVRLLTTSFTLGSGGAGGVFAPALFFGSSVGLLFGHLLGLIPFFDFANPGAYALVGMAGLAAGIMSAPLTGMFITLEICGSYDLILPLMLTALSSMLVSRYLEEGSIYTRKLIYAGTYKRRGTEAQLLADMDLAEIVTTCPEIENHETMGQFIEKYGTDQRSVYALVNEEGCYQGLIFLEDVRPYMFDQALHPLITMASIADVSVPTMGANATPDMAWVAFANTSRDALPVLDGEDRLIGIVTKSALFDSARTEMSVHDEA